MIRHLVAPSGPHLVHKGFGEVPTGDDSQVRRRRGRARAPDRVIRAARSVLARRGHDTLHLGVDGEDGGVVLQAKEEDDKQMN